ncbi:MAG: hypothetical protein GY847_17995 [Proteobacteria bacterium]|nr:hypothetical protein [Pseudomonadota bacterium]
MRITRRQTVLGGLAAIPLAGGNLFPKQNPAPENWRIWLRVKSDEGDFMIGAMGQHACCGFHTMVNGCFQIGPWDTPSKCSRPEDSVRAGAVAADVPFLLKSPGAMRDVPDGWGWFLVVPDGTKLYDIMKIKAQIQTRASWIMVLEDPLSFCYSPPDGLEYVNSDWSTCDDILSYLFAHPNLFYSLRKHNQGALISAHRRRGSSWKLLSGKSEYAHPDGFLWHDEEPSLEGWVLHYNISDSTPENQLEDHLSLVRRSIPPDKSLETIVYREKDCQGTPLCDQLVVFVWR